MTDRRANWALAVLTFVNLFNYIDRWVVAAVVEPVKRDLGLSDTQMGLIGTSFIVVYMLVSPVFGFLGDRKVRPPLIALGVGIWSLATGVAGFVRGFWSLFIARSLVGVGEGAYGTIAPALLADQFPLERRGRVRAVFFSAIPIGSAAGYVLGGLADQYFGWRAAFWLVGFPGIVLALLVLTVKDPPRGQHDPGGAAASGMTPSGAAAASAAGAATDSSSGASAAGAATDPSSGASAAGAATDPSSGASAVGGRGRPPLHEGGKRGYAALFANVPYILSVLGYAAYTFALGGLGFWMPAFLERARGMTRADATVTFGSIVIVTGFLGTFIGGFLGDRLLARTRQSYLWVSGIATLVAAPLTFVGLWSASKPVYLTAIVIAEVLIFMCTGPVNSAIVNAVSPVERATAVGLSVFVMHLFGDIPSPPLIGWISDRDSIAHGVLVVPVAVFIAGVIWSYAAWRGERAA
jgi:MFS family permease